MLLFRRESIATSMSQEGYQRRKDVPAPVVPKRLSLSLGGVYSFCTL